MKVWNDAMCKTYKMSGQTETGDQISYNLGQYFLLLTTRSWSCSISYNI